MKAMIRRAQRGLRFLVLALPATLLGACYMSGGELITQDEADSPFGTATHYVMMNDPSVSFHRIRGNDFRVAKEAGSTIRFDRFVDARYLPDHTKYVASYCNAANKGCLLMLVTQDRSGAFLTWGSEDLDDHTPVEVKSLAEFRKTMRDLAKTEGFASKNWGAAIAMTDPNTATP